MQPRLDVLTLGVPDLDAARRFYIDGLGWEPLLEVPGEIVFVQVGHGRLLALWRADALETDIFGDGAPAAATRHQAPA
jgi:catechol 2,3-dioxygenase-like lactoylglutathione lyase family enzyme